MSEHRMQEWTGKILLVPTLFQNSRAATGLMVSDPFHQPRFPILSILNDTCPLAESTSLPSKGTDPVPTGMSVFVSRERE